VPNVEQLLILHLRQHLMLPLRPAHALFHLRHKLSRVLFGGQGLVSTFQLLIRSSSLIATGIPRTISR
jgi:hypothetical protein